MKTHTLSVNLLNRLAAPVKLCLWMIVGSWLFLGCKKEEKAPLLPPVIKVVNISTTSTTGKAIALDATGTTDPQQKTLTYSWAIKSKPTGSNAVITNPSSAVASLVPDKPGTYVLVLTVTNADGQTSTQELTITVAIPGSPPVASAGVSSTVSVGRKVTLDGSKSSDPDNDRLTYAWTIKSKPTGSNPTIANADKAVAELTPDGVGVYVMTLTISDGNWPVVTADVTVTVTVPTIREVSASWTAANGTGGGDDYTPRNHFYTFEVASNNQPVSLSLTSSDINVGFYVYNPNGEVIDQYGSGFGRSQTEDIIVNAGKYTVIVCSGKRYDIGAYTLKGRGLATEFTRIAALRQNAANISFGQEGGGGGEYTPRNHYYTFDVTADNAYTDINVQSSETNLWLSLFGPAGSRISYTYGGTPRHLIEKLNKGSYGLWVGSDDRDAVGKYILDIFGQVANLKQYVFDSSILTDEYRGKNTTTTYTLNVTENNTIIDVSVRSPDIGTYINLYNPNGQEIGYYTGPTKYGYFIRAATKGQYKVILTPAGSGIGKYTLSVYGKFTDLKKQ